MGGKLTGSSLHLLAMPGAALAQPPSPLLLALLPLNPKPVPVSSACAGGLCDCASSALLLQSSPSSSPLPVRSLVQQHPSIYKNINLLAIVLITSASRLFTTTLRPIFTLVRSLIVKVLIRWKNAIIKKTGGLHLTKPLLACRRSRTGVTT